MNKDSLYAWFSRQSVDLIAIDGDDTLWYDAKYFAALREQLFALARDLGEGEVAVRRRMDYWRLHQKPGEEGFAAAVLETARDLGAGEHQLVSLRGHSEAFLNHPVELLPYAQESVSLLQRFWCFLVTKGQSSEQRRKLKASGLDDLFREIVILESKNVETIGRVFRSAEVPASRTIFIGNSLEHDITPAILNGARAIWVNHKGNDIGRHGTKPPGVYEVDSWYPIYLALRKGVKE